MKNPLAVSVPDKLFNRLVIGLVGLGFVTLLTVAGFGVYVMQRNIAFTDLVAHTYGVENALGNMRALNERTETTRRGYLLSRDERFAHTYRQTVASVDPAVEKIRRLTADNPPQQARVARLKDLIRQQREAADRSIRDARAGLDQSTAAFATDAAVLRTRDIRDLAVVMGAEEQKLLDARNDARLATIQNLSTVATVGGLILLIVAVGSIWVILRYTRDLNVSRDQLRQVNEGLEELVHARTAELQRANDEIQRFAYIVSHDLRSPLVNVMGFTAELETAIGPLVAMLEKAKVEAPHLVSEDARLAVEVDLPEAVSFIRTSTQKMDRLINAILRLSREGRRVLTPEPVAMTAIAASVVDNLRHRTDQLGAVIEVATDIPGLVSDRLALEQIFSNLVENALKYLKPGRSGHIRIDGRREGGRLVYEVTDNGRGVDPKDHERIFDLFRRSGAQDQPGEGIGLAHVRALTYRLGGVIACQSVLDQGATFRVSLPAKLTAEGATA
ncbi:MAG: histidine kinase [Caulobacteraceae bacterium]|nr:histidine kinase [Caulobacteraceae bacterium]